MYSSTEQNKFEYPASHQSCKKPTMVIFEDTKHIVMRLLKVP